MLEENTGVCFKYPPADLTFPGAFVVPLLSGQFRTDVLSAPLNLVGFLWRSRTGSLLTDRPAAGAVVLIAGRVLRQRHVVSQPQVFGDAHPGPGEFIATNLTIVMPHCDALASKLLQIINLLPAVGFLQVGGESGHGEERPRAELAGVLAAIEPFLGLVGAGHGDGAGAGTGLLHHLNCV